MPWRTRVIVVNNTVDNMQTTACDNRMRIRQIKYKKIAPLSEITHEDYDKCEHYGQLLDMLDTVAG